MSDQVTTYTDDNWNRAKVCLTTKDINPLGHATPGFLTMSKFFALRTNEKQVAVRPALPRHGRERVCTMNYFFVKPDLSVLLMASI